MSLKVTGRAAFALLGVLALAAPARAADAGGVRERVEAHVAAGEFALAADAARGALGQEQAELLGLIAGAQAQSGDYDAARATVRRTDGAPRRGAGGPGMLAGGGAQANFGPLMQLILENTSGEWEIIDQVGGSMSPFFTGVHVAPNGMIGLLTQEDRAGRLKGLGLEARRADLNEDMARPSELRLVSLTRLEKEVARRVEAGEPVLETMRHLAGLQKIQYLFVYPEDGEIVVGGPAEGWRYNEQGTPVGAASGRPTLQLDDFVTVLRIFSPRGSNEFGCLIVPRQEGLKKAKEFADASSARGPLAPGSVRNWAKQIQDRLGEQDAVFRGVSDETRVASVMLEADYRMKLIGIGRLDGGPGIPSYFDLLTPAAIKQSPPQMDALRWWLTMKYDAVLHSPDRNVFEVVGSSVKCLSENELITDEGTRIHTGKADPTNQQFAQNFTKHYAKLAARDLVFADLQNIFDLALVAALLQHEDVAKRTGWDGGTFAAGGGYRVAKYAAPKTVMSVANHRVYGGKEIVVQVAGGVTGDVLSVLKDGGVYQEQVRLGQLAGRGKAPQLPEGRWWWNAAK